MIRRGFVLFALAVVAPLAWAAPTGITSTESSRAQAESVEQGTARYWGLSVDEYRRSQALMRGVRGSFSDPKITPLEVLGIHAANDAERRKYAEMFARLMAEDAGRIVKFQDEYQRAIARLYPDLKVIELANPPRLPSPQKVLASVPSIPTTGVKAFGGGSLPRSSAPMSQPSKLAGGDRILVFASADCAGCASAVRQAMAKTQNAIGVDLYVLGASNDADVQRYAQSMGVDPGDVQRGVVTLNIDRGTFGRVLPWKPELPQVVRRRGSQLQQLLVTDL